MAEGGKDQNPADNSWESWIGGWYQTAKEKSAVAMEMAKEKSSIAMEMVKKDLSEFSTVMQKETEKVVEKTSSQLKGSLNVNNEDSGSATNGLKAGLTSFLDSVTKVLVIPHDDDDSIPMKVSTDGTGLYDKGKARLHALQLDVGTYTETPHGSPEQFSMWLESFDLDQHKGDISDLLVSKVEVRALYTKLVPIDVSHAEFWQRYFYRVHQLDVDEARKKALMQRAEQTRGDSLGWDDDDEDDWSDREADEDDDGNQSDWEKLPRPNQAVTPPTPKPCPELKSQSPEISKTTEISEQIETKSTDPKSEQIETKSTDPKSSNIKKEINISEVSTETPSYQAENLSSQQSLPLSETATNDSKSNEVKEQDSQSSQMPTSELWSLHIPNDTASAAQDDVISEVSNINSSDNPATSSDQSSIVNDNSTCGAAAGGAAVTQDLENTADGACGAVGVESSPSCQKIESPAASATEEKSTISTNKDTDATDVKPSEDKSVSKAEEVNPVTCSSSETQLSDINVDGENKIAMKVKGDMVVVGDGVSSSEDSSEAKDVGLEDDWEEDFDVELTEEDLKAAEDIAKKLGEGASEDADDDWENWE